MKRRAFSLLSALIVKNSISIPTAKWTLSSRSKVVQNFLNRPSVTTKAETVARNVLEDLQKHGDACIKRAVHQFDGFAIKLEQFRVGPEEIAAATKQVDADFKRAAKETKKRVTAFCKAGMRPDWSMKTPKGGSLGEQFKPLDRVGAYIPGGAAPLASTAMMSIVLAKVAGVPEIVACTPCNSEGEIDPFLLYAISLAGATEIYRFGGIQAIGAMAYGTETIRPVQKIVGPGGPYVTAAKKLVYGHVALDSVAGPSEIGILADGEANPAFVAADLLSQAEHGTGLEKSLLVTDSAELATAVKKELLRQTALLSRTEMIKKVLQEGTLIVVVPDIETGTELINRFAAEHLELLTKDAKARVKKIRAAGAIFVGPWSPESAGDFAVGPSHVLPTGGTAAFFSGLTVDDFRRRSSVISLTKNDLKDVLPVIEAFGRIEGLDAHSRSAQIRFEQ